LELIKEATMHARLTSLSGSPSDLEGAIANFREQVVPFTNQHGGKGAILLVDRQSGSAIAITLWEDEEALRASEEKANELRAQAAEELGASERPTVTRYEVAVFET
jgi:heme-degrading monooxygenase HmoA